MLHNKSIEQQYGFILNLVIFIVCIFVSFILLSSRAGAITGAGNYFPDTSPSGQARSYAIVQVTGSNVVNANSKMKARTTVANVYVPKSLEGQNVSVKIVNGCHGTIRDNETWAGNTDFYVKNRTTGQNSPTVSTNTPGVCSGTTDMILNFTATPMIASTDLDKSQIFEDGVQYNVYEFIAQGKMIEAGNSSRYLNAFGLEPITSGLQVGISNFPERCDITNYPMSCPSPRLYNGSIASWVYTSFYGPLPASLLANYDQRIKIRSSCTISGGGISLYDIDASTSNLTQPNLSVQLLRNGVAQSVTAPNGTTFNKLDKLGMQFWQNGVPGLLYAHPDIPGQIDSGGNNNEYMDIPGGPPMYPSIDPMFASMGTFEANVDYELRIIGIDSDNALQILPNYPLCSGTTSPVGYVDSCEVISGQVYIKGWAYDDNAGLNDGKPQISVSISDGGGWTSDVIADTDKSPYREAEIEAFLDSKGYGSNARDHIYGFELVYDNLYQGKTYSINGVVKNVGPGTDQPLGINHAPTRNDLAGYGFKNDIIPNQCLLPAPEAPVCIINTQSVLLGEEFYPYVLVSNGSTSSINLSSANYQVTRNGSNVYNGKVLPSGTARPYNIGTSTYQDYEYTLAGDGGQVTIRSDNPHIILDTGNYDISWDISISGGLSVGGDCGQVTQGALGVRSEPYTRFYGNDVIAGGGYGDCSISSSINAQGYGRYATGTQDQSSYQGTASELAVFATGLIDGVMPGAQTVRSSVDELAFANDGSADSSLATLPYGGGFNEQICAGDYWNQVSDKTKLSALPTGPVNLTTLGTGVYYYDGNMNVVPSNIENSKRITIYVNGDVVIGPSINTNNYDQTVSYTQPNSSWGVDINRLPLVKIVAYGNIYIDNNISQVDGLYVAVPRDSTTGGIIQTCVKFDGSGVDDLSANESFTAIECNHKLTVNGAFIARYVKLMRTNGNILSAGTPETTGSANIAESFNFSPELYLALLSENGATSRFDAILSLPPAL
ncbi:hypothetical protein KC960_02420 [Candidatus Saccharibacteria bacterium]|nr:hypothetical protein [Candidatus Saccharibacteria bacterium]